MENKTPKFRLENITSPAERVSSMIITILAEISSNNRSKKESNVSDCSCDPFCNKNDCECYPHCPYCSCDHDCKCQGYDPCPDYKPCSCDYDTRYPCSCDGDWG